MKAPFEIRSVAEVELFRQEAEAFLLRDEDRNNLLLSLLRYMTGTPREKGAAVYRTIVANGHVVGAAMRTGDDRALVVSEMPREALVPLWKSVANLAVPVAELTGPEDLVDALVVESGRASELFLHLGAYKTDAVIDPPPVSGRLRLATLGDMDLLEEWSRAFSLEALGRAGNERAAIEDKVKGEGYWLWEDGEPVCQAHAGAPTTNGIRITGVYTPKSKRGRGYASGCVAAATRALLGRGHRTVFLFTDLKNPTSNSIYQKIGFRHFANMKHVKLL